MTWEIPIIFVQKQKLIFGCMEYLLFVIAVSVAFVEKLQMTEGLYSSLLEENTGTVKQLSAANAQVHINNDIKIVAVFIAATIY